MSGSRRGAQQTAVQEPAADPFGASLGLGGELLGSAAAFTPQAMPVNPPGPRADAAMAQIIVAQRVPVKRNMLEILREARILAAQMGDDAFYFWETRNADGTRGQVIGPSIDCAMAAVSLYGNCSIEAFPAQESDTHWTFLARFVDYERGVSVTRSFQQRKAQRLGKKMDIDRQLDMVFQMGQSKASRNAVVAGLKFLTSEMVRAARTGLMDRIGKKPEEARAAIQQKAQAMGVPLAWVEHSVGRKVEKWTVPDMAKLLAQFQAIADGSANPEDLFADPNGDAEETDHPEPTATAVAGDKAERPKRKDPPPPEGGDLIADPHPAEGATMDNDDRWVGE